MIPATWKAPSRLAAHEFSDKPLIAGQKALLSANTPTTRKPLLGLTVEETVAAQVGAATGRRFRAIRLLRHASEYPSPGQDGAARQAALDAVRFAEALRDGVRQLLPQMGVFG
jgi:hypothetical protein